MLSSRCSTHGLTLLALVGSLLLGGCDGRGTAARTATADAPKKGTASAANPEKLPEDVPQGLKNDDPSEAAPVKNAKKPEGPKRQPDGVPFPLPDPLPQPRTVSEAPAPHPGPEPLAFWVGGRGTDDGRFHYPRAIVVGKDDTAYIVDKSGRIQRFSDEGKLLAVVSTPAIEQGKPTGLGIDPDGNLLVSDTHYCRVLIYSPELKLLRWYGAPGKPAGNFMLLTSVQAGEGGLHYTLDYGDDIARLQVFKDDGTYLRGWGAFGDGPSDFNRPMALAVDDGRDRLYVADAVNHRISVFTRAGEHVTAFGGPGKEPGELNYPYDVELDARGNVWVAEFGNQRVTAFDTEGECLGTWGAPARRPPGLNRSWGLALAPRERLWVLDSGSDRAYVLARATILGGAKGSRVPR
jgi:streptogramin lyase